MMPESHPEVELPITSTGGALPGLMVLLAADRDQPANGAPLVPAVGRPEAVVADVRFSYQENARLSGKKAEAVRRSWRHTKKQTSAEEPKK
jgi:hypothetical protein